MTVTFSASASRTGWLFVFGPALPEPLFQFLHQSSQFQRHQSEHRIEFGSCTFLAFLTQFVLDLVEEAQLAHYEFIVEGKRQPVLEYETQLEHLLTRLEMLPYLVAFKLLAPAFHHRAGLDRIAQFAFVA